MKTEDKLCQCPYNKVITCDMSDPCSGCEDFTGEPIVPKKKERLNYDKCYKEQPLMFKVGDWVENTSGIYDGHNVVQIVEITSSGYHLFITKYGNRAGLWSHQMKHTTKPKEQPLMFKGHEVKVGDGRIGGHTVVGCRELSNYSILGFISICEAEEGHATPNEIYDFIKANRERLEL